MTATDKPKAPGLLDGKFSPTRPLAASGTLFAFAAVSIAVLVLRRTDPTRHRPFRTPAVALRSANRLKSRATPSAITSPTSRWKSSDSRTGSRMSSRTSLAR